MANFKLGHSGSFFEKHAFNLAFFLALLVLHSLLYRQMWFGELIYGSDTVLQYFPWRVFAHQHLTTLGRISEYNPYAFSGLPFGANFLTFGLYPLGYVLTWLPPVWASNLTWFIHSLLGSWFTFLLFSSLCKERFAGVIGSLVFAFSGLLILRVYGGHPDIFAVLTLTPPLFYCWYRYFNSGSRIWVVIAATCFACQILAVSPQLVLLAHYLLFAIFIWVLVSLSKTKQERVHHFLMIMLYLALGVGLSAAFLFPGFLSLADSVRDQGLSWEYIVRYSLPPKQVLGFFLPHFYGSGILEPFLGRPVPWEASTYLGLSTLPFALNAKWHERSRQLLLLFALAFLALSFGGFLAPLYRFFLEALPIQKAFRVPSRNLAVFVMIYCFLIADGMSNLLTNKLRLERYKITLLVGLGLTSLVIILPPCRRFLIGNTETDLLSSWHLALAVTCYACVVMAMVFFANTQPRKKALICCVIVCLDLVLANQIYIKPAEKDAFSTAHFDFGDWRLFDTTKKMKFRTQGTMHGFYSVGGIHQLVPKRYNDFLNVSQGTPLAANNAFFLGQVFSPPLSLVSTRWVIADKDYGDSLPLTRIGRFGDVFIYENKDAFPRAYFVDRLDPLTSKEDFLHMVRSNPLALRDQAYSETVIKSVSFGKPIGEPTLSSRKEEKVTWTLPSSDAESFLVLSDNFNRGWSAKANGKPVTIARVNWFMQGILIPPATTSLELTFKTEGFASGKKVAISFLLCSILLGYIFVRRDGW